MSKESEIVLMLQEALNSDTVAENVSLSMDPIKVNPNWYDRVDGTTNGKGQSTGVYLKQGPKGKPKLEFLNVYWTAYHYTPDIPEINQSESPLTPETAAEKLREVPIEKLKQRLGQIRISTPRIGEIKEMSEQLEKVLASREELEQTILREGAVRLAYSGPLSWFNIGPARGLYLNLRSAIVPQLDRLDDWFFLGDGEGSIGTSCTEATSKQGAAYLSQRKVTPEKLRARLSEFGLN